jgi:hypothetical protein
MAETIWTPGFVPGNQKVNVKIKNADGGTIDDTVFTLREAYSIAIYSGNNQTGPFGQPLYYPIRVIVKDIAGNPFPGVTVNFTANNGGSVSQAHVTTGADGIAGVWWTLGNTERSQTVTVTAFKADNVTPLQGSPLTFSASVPFQLWESYGGGIIFRTDGQHGLIAATSDQGIAPWGCWGTTIPGTHYNIGTGQANTTLIVNGCSEAPIAARICNDLGLNGYDDWFLPSYDELSIMWEWQIHIGGFTYDLYWSSSESQGSSCCIALNLLFGSGSRIYRYNKERPSSVRCVRSF